MEKIKKNISDHRYGLFFFGALICYGLFISETFRSLEYEGVGYSFYCVDFSVGFCSKLLPGAIYNFLIGKYNQVAIAVYVKVLVVFVFCIISILLEHFVKSTVKEKRTEAFLLSVMAVSVFSYFLFEAGLFRLLDFHWIMATVIFFVLLSNKKLYIFIPFVFVYTVMTHYVSLICYIPACLLVLLCKLIYVKEKKEKVFLGIIFVISIIASVGLSAYFALFELDNVKLSYPAFNSLLTSRGVESTEYYNYSFFRENIEEVFKDYYTDETIGLATNIDTSKGLINVFIQNAIQHFKINLYLADHRAGVFETMSFGLIVYFVFKGITIKMKNKNFFEKLVHFCSVLLFVFILAIGLLFSTDTIRWIGNAFLSLMIYYFYVVFSGKEDGSKMLAVVSSVPRKLLYLYVAVCVTVPFI